MVRPVDSVDEHTLVRAVTLRPFNTDAYPFSHEDNRTLFSVWIGCIMQAGASMAGYRARAIMNEHGVRSLIVGPDFARQDNRRARLAVYAITHSIRAGIAARTAREESDAAHRVSHLGATFYAPSCAGESCPSLSEPCSHPLYAHIRMMHASFCPSDGRAYWQMAREILRRDGLTPDQIRGVLSDIARKVST